MYAYTQKRPYINVPKEHFRGCKANCEKVIFLGGRGEGVNKESVKRERKNSLVQQLQGSCRVFTGPEHGHLSPFLQLSLALHPLMLGGQLFPPSLRVGGRR